MTKCSIYGKLSCSELKTSPFDFLENSRQQRQPRPRRTQGEKESVIVINIYRFFVTFAILALFGAGCSSYEVNAPGGTMRQFHSPLYSSGSVNMSQASLDTCNVQRTQQQWNNLQMARFARENGIWIQIPWSVDNDAYCRNWMMQQFGGQGLQFNGNSFGFPGGQMMPGMQGPMTGGWSMNSGSTYIAPAGGAQIMAAPVGQVTLQDFMSRMAAAQVRQDQDIQGLADGLDHVARRR